MARLTPTKEVIRRLFAISGNQCAFTGCSNRLIDENGTLIAQVCHIEAAEKGGPRYNENQSDEDRRAFSNLLILCHEHHKVTDDVVAYRTEDLQKLKEEHESKFYGNTYEIPPGFEDRVFREIDDLFQITQQTLTATQQTLTAVLETGELGKKANETLEKLEGMLAKALQSQQPVATDDSSLYALQLEFIKDFRKQKKPQTAFNALLKYKEEHWDKIGAELQYKVLANLGTLYFELGKKVEGAELLLELKAVSYESVDRLAYLCLGYAILKRKEEFEPVFERARGIQADNPNLWIAYIVIQGKNISADEIENNIPESIRERSEILYTLGEAYLDRDEITKGFELLQKSIEQSNAGIEDNWYVLNLVESKRLTHIATIAKIALKKFSADEIASLKNSRAVLTTVWDYVSKTEFAASAWGVVLNRGIINKILGDNLDAEHDLEEAWRLSRHFFAFKDLIFHYIDTGNLDKAENILISGRAAAADRDDETEFITIEARLRSAQEQPEKAVKLLASRLDDVSGEDRLRLLDLIIISYFQCGAFGKALPFSQQLIDEFGDRPEGYLAAGICHRVQNELNEALSSFEKTIERAYDDERMPHIWFQLGIEYSKLEKHEMAVMCFEKIAGPVGYDEVHRKLLFEYYHAEEYDKAIALCLQLKELEPDVPLIYEILFRAYQDAGKIDEAESVLQECLATVKDEHHDYFRLLGVQYYTKLGESDKAVQLILQIEKPEKFSLEHRLILAKHLLGSDYVDEGLEIAYNARLDHYNRAETHEMYIWCCVGRREQPSEVSFPNAIAMDCAVQLVDQSGAQKDFFLTDDKRYQSAAILRSEDRWTGLLLNKQLGDTITMPNSIGTGQILTVNTILNKHVYAFRESGELLETKFSGETSMLFFKSEGDDKLSTLHQFIKDQSLQSQQNRQKILRLYEGDVVTVGMLGHYFGRNFVEMWFDLINSTDIFLRCYTQDEAPAISKALSRTDTIILDPLSLLTNLILLPEHNLLDHFAGRYVVAQSTITELKNYKKELELRGANFSVGVEEGEVRKHENTQEAMDNTVRLIQTVIDWCERNAQVKSPVKRSNRTGHYEIDVIAMIGEAFHDTVALASETNGFILCDDERLKSFALGEYGVEGFSSYQVAALHANLGTISIEDYSSISKALMAANYAFIPVSGMELWKIFEEGGFRLRPPFTRSVRGVRILSIKYCAFTLVTFAKQLYLNVAVQNLREQTMLYLLQEAKRNSDYIAIRSLVLLLIDREFILMPQQGEGLKGVISSLQG